MVIEKKKITKYTLNILHSLTDMTQRLKNLNGRNRKLDHN